MLLFFSSLAYIKSGDISNDLTQKTEMGHYFKILKNETLFLAMDIGELPVWTPLFPNAFYSFDT